MQWQPEYENMMEGRDEKKSAKFCTSRVFLLCVLFYLVKTALSHKQRVHQANPAEDVDVM